MNKQYYALALQNCLKEYVLESVKYILSTRLNRKESDIAMFTILINSISHNTRLIEYVP